MRLDSSQTGTYAQSIITLVKPLGMRLGLIKTAVISILLTWFVFNIGCVARLRRVVEAASELWIKIMVPPPLDLSVRLRSVEKCVYDWGSWLVVAV